ncbi:MAG: hypothetical protein AAF598_13575, partial [Bacteroidota bacterium]
LYRKGNDQLEKITGEIIKKSAVAQVDEQTKQYYRFMAKYMDYYDPNDSKFYNIADEKLVELSRSLEHFYLIPRSRIFMEMRARKGITENNFIFHNYTAFKAKLTHYKDNDKVLEAYQIALRLYQTLDLRLWEPLKDLLQELLDILAPSEFMGLISAAVNSALREGQKNGNGQTNQTIFGMYSFVEDMGIFDRFTVFPRDQFFNIVVTYCAQLEIDRARRFINSYLDRLNSSFIKDAETFAESAILFFELKHNFASADLKQIRELLIALSKNPFKNFSDAYRLKDYLSRSFYLIDDLKSLERELNNYEIWLGRWKARIAEELGIAIHNTIKQYKVLLKIKLKLKKEKPVDFDAEEKELIKYKRSITNSWVMEMFGLLRNK